MSCLRLWLYFPQVSYAVLSWKLIQAVLPMKGFGAVSRRWNNMYHSFMPRHWSGKIAGNLAQCVRVLVVSVGSICKDASCGKSQDLMLSHWVPGAFRRILLSWKPSVQFVVRSQMIEQNRGKQMKCILTSQMRSCLIFFLVYLCFTWALF